MLTRTVTLLTSAALVAPAIFVPARSSAQTASHNATIPFDGASRVQIEARAGYLKVQGRAGATTVTVRATARASNSELLSQVSLVAERRGDVIHVEAVMPEIHSSGWFGNNWAALDLDIIVPAGASVSAKDASGDAEFRGTGNLRVDDGSGNLMISDVMGEVEIDDSSGDVTLVNVTGPVKIDDGSGAIRMEGVGRDITISDGSGEITLRRVANVLIESDGSGGISIAQASGTVRIVSPGSGGVSVSDVSGDFVVESGRASRVRYQNVRGTVTVPRR